MKRIKQTADLKVFISTQDSMCDECGENLGRRAWITLVKDKGALCLSCADLDHLVFLPSGDAALTRRARKHSTLAAVVLKWTRARKRYERQGLLVESEALERAERECLADSEARARRREREEVRRVETAYPTPGMLIPRCLARSVSDIPSSRTAQKQRRLLALPFFCCLLFE